MKEDLKQLLNELKSIDFLTIKNYASLGVQLQKLKVQR